MMHVITPYGRQHRSLVSADRVSTEAGAGA
jgi:hypothetical protein